MYFQRKEFSIGTNIVESFPFKAFKSSSWHFGLMHSLYLPQKHPLNIILFIFGSSLLNKMPHIFTTPLAGNSERKHACINRRALYNSKAADLKLIQSLLQILPNILPGFQAD